MMISPQQIKAARAMLDWTQDGLAQACGLSLNTIHSLENGHQSPRSSSIVQRALENKGFEFFDKNGLCLRTHETHTYQGANSSDKFYEDLLAGAKENGGDVAAVFWSQEALVKSLGVTNLHHLERLEQLAQYTKIKCLLVDVRELSLDIPFFEFRTITNYHGFRFPTITTGNRSTIIVPNIGNHPIYFVVAAIDTAQKGWNEFLPLWDKAVPLTAPSTPHKRRA